MICLFLFPFIVSTQPKTKIPEKFFANPEALAKAFVTTIQQKNSIALKALVPTNKELNEWFSKIKIVGEENIAQQKELLNWSSEWSYDGAEYAYRKIQSIQNLKIKQIKYNIREKYFYKESDIYLFFNDGIQVKLKDCVQGDKGWFFIHEIKIIK